MSGLDVKWAYKYAMTEPGSARRVASAQAWGFVTTDANGWYIVPDLDAGVYWVEPMGDPGGPDFWNPPARYVEVRTADVPDQHFQVATATTKYAITITVINDNTGYGVQGERVRLNRMGIGTWEVETDWEGKAIFADLWPGVYGALPPTTTTYAYQPASVDCILLDQNVARSFRVTPSP